jgi:hypothetical protein
MSDKLIDQSWFLTAVNPSASEIEYLQQNYSEVVRRTNLETAQGIEPQVAVIKVCKEMLGK